MSTPAIQLVPALDEVLLHRGDHTHLALSVTLRADEHTPISLFRRVAGEAPRAFLLESVTGGENIARYSFFGCDIERSIEFADGTATLRTGTQANRVDTHEPLRLIRDALTGFRVAERPDLPRFQGGAVGYIGFDCMRYFERVPLPNAPGLGLPEMVMFLPEEIFIFDHLAHTLTIVEHVPLAGDRAGAYAAAEARVAVLIERIRTSPLSRELHVQHAPAPDPVWEPNRSRQNFLAAVEEAQEAIRAGELFQVVVSRRETAQVSVSPLALYRALRSLNPSPYMFYFAFDGFAVVGASPEVLVRVENRELLLRPIAGTRPRGVREADDLALERDLLSDEKELAEHRMLVDLGRNDLGRVARTGSVTVEHPLHIERYSHVMHIVSDLRAELAEGMDAFDVFEACFPAGTVSGAPKIRACEHLSRLEPDRRGVYAGAIGYFDYRGNMDTCIAIRTAVVEPNAVHLQAGAGIVYDSVPASEYEECGAKMGAVRAAVRRALADGEQ
jgi:anthranilate synthase component 1